MLTRTDSAKYSILYQDVDQDFFMMQVEESSKDAFRKTMPVYRQ